MPDPSHTILLAVAGGLVALLTSVHMLILRRLVTRLDKVDMELTNLRTALRLLRAERKPEDAH